jgi:hypothetical protein
MSLRPMGVDDCPRMTPWNVLCTGVFQIGAHLNECFSHDKIQ